MTGPDPNGDLRSEYRVACRRARCWPLPGSGGTYERFTLLANVARQDLVLGRLVEAHADAIAILSELAGIEPGLDERWGVWAAGPPDGVRAVHSQSGWRLTGRKPWCSGAGLVTHALVDAWTDDGQRLFSVDLTGPEISAGEAVWVGPGMGRADTRDVGFEEATGVPVGTPGQYLSRPGFWAGAIGVAACWHGGATRVAEALLRRAGHVHDPHAWAHLGYVHAALHTNRALFRDAAAQIDAHPEADVFVSAAVVRSTVERNAADIMDRVGRAVGPGPLAHDLGHATTVADLAVYIRQHHGERDLAQLGEQLSGQERPWPE
jgi:alkylation response protein AidB-like acyl-CoA dehydrogenase